MRNYWLRIILGALAIFAIGMVGVTLVRGGVARVHRVVEGTGPITIPLALLPFKLGPDKLGTLSELVLLRDSPRRITEVRLEVEVDDSMVATGLGGCRLAANVESDPREPGVHVRGGRLAEGAFWCLEGDSVPPGMVRYGQATFQPGDVTVPLYLTQGLVAELQHGNMAPDSAAAIAEQRADSIASSVEGKADSLADRMSRLGDSLRAEGRRRGDSVRAALREAARDSAQ
ncbi:MAG: hypothetical protein ACREMX_15900 [Gemmatimonadales bacterium]